MLALILQVLYFTILFFYIGILLYEYYYGDVSNVIASDDIKVFYKDGTSKKVRTFGKIKQPQDVLKIDCSNCRLGSLEGIEQCVNLTELDCSRNVLVSLSDKNANPLLPSSLIKINCSRNFIYNLYGLQHCTNLVDIDCSVNYISFLSSLQNLSNLQYLKCSGNRLTTLYGIDTCLNLKEIHCDNNYISFLPIFILNLKELYDVNIEGNPIEMADVIVGSEVESFVSRINGKKISRVKVYNDAQNTHNSAIVRAIKTSIQNIMKEEPVSLETLNL
jgi:Leucine-rich repeat (LRR) protein